MAFMPFITAGDPDLATTQKVLLELAARDVDLIEIGFPYSDPIADGPVIQASYTRALGKHLHVDDIFAAVKALPRSGSSPLPPLVAMVAYAIIFRVGPERFVHQAQDAGFSGLIVPDLPADEAAEMAALSRARGLDLIQLIAPTTTPDRTKRIFETASGFIYCISVAGTTGVRDELPAELREQLKWLKTQTKLPLAVGFGISRPDQIESLRGLADGVIVGSALVRHISAIAEQKVSVETALQNVGKLATEMAAATHRA
jgi:tryptophan synthase alpha chain